MLTIWGRGNSNNVKKALWCLEELGLAYEHIPAGGAFGIVDDAAYRAMNPNGLVPTIRDGDLILWESNAIVRYLAAKYGAGTLWLDDPAERAEGDRWMDWTTSSFAASFRDVFWNMVRTEPEKRDMAAVAQGLERCGKLLAIVDEALSRQPFLSGAAFGIGDIPLGCFIYGWFAMPIERPDLPHLSAWYQALATRPAYQKAVMTALT
ncbi:glutathione S-transferase [Kaistia dalseonensis]|uniref:Glutathione S-transferase n=1 Tax=Kaistia dalseonensis TaxID=410840 RepID=A0ABU0H2T6_9HYPH|nr:glutathione S-transferase [Kaistia dalseonensis]MCX5493221.1 glutathione S-transferase [Kaistia dalseonensis]MDQ0435776.1 glutathione S-transferase [Kaistia dalseonensis]